MKEVPHFDAEKVRQAANIAHRIARKEVQIENLAPAVELGVELSRLVGKTVEQFRELESGLREHLRNAAIIANHRLDNDDSLFGFLRYTSGYLKRCANTSDTSGFAKIAVFLLALISPQEAASLKQHLHLI